MSEQPPAWMGFLDEPDKHSFVPSTSDSRRCFTCTKPPEEHTFELEYLERRRQEMRERERYGRPRPDA